MEEGSNIHGERKPRLVKLSGKFRQQRFARAREGTGVYWWYKKLTFQCKFFVQTRRVYFHSMCQTNYSMLVIVRKVHKVVKKSNTTRGRKCEGIIAQISTAVEVVARDNVGAALSIYNTVSKIKS